MGWLIHQAIQGAANQRPRIGRASGNCAGCITGQENSARQRDDRRDPHGGIKAGEIRAGRAFATSLEVCHSRSRLRVTSKRTSVRPMASRLTKAS